MNHYGVYLILTLTAILYIGVSCFVKKEMIKNITLSILSVVAIVCIGTVIGRAYCAIERFNYNAWYSQSTEDLIGTIIKKLEDGQQEQVIEELKKLESQIGWRYEVRGHYDEHVRETIKNLNTDQTQ
jgi:hypothetical protein